MSPPPVSAGKRTRSNVTPNDPRLRWRLWVRVVGADGGYRIVVFWRRVAIFLAVLAVLGWFALGGVAYLLLQHRHDFTDISYTNLILPHRWPEHRRALGKFYIQRADRAVKEGKWSEAYQFYSAGIARAPEDFEARRRFATFSNRLGQPAISARILTEGLRHGQHDLEYLRHTFTQLLELNREAEVLARTAQYMPATPTDRLTDAFLALQAATAHYRLGRYDAAEQISRAWQLERSVEGILLMSLCDWERGQTEIALQRLELGREHHPGRDEITLQLIRFHRELGDHARARREALVRVSNDPLSPGPRVDLLHSLHRLGETTQFARETELYFRDFSQDPGSLLLIARLGADLGLVNLAQRATAAAKLRALPSAPFLLSEIEALVNAERYGEARRLADSLQTDFPSATPAGRLLTGWRAVATYADRDPTNGEVLLQAFTGDPMIRANEVLVLAEPMERIGAYIAARRLLAAVVQRQPDNQAALTRLIRLDASQGNLAGLDENLPLLLAMGKPSRAVLQEAYSALNEATPTRAALRRAVGEAVSRLTSNPEPMR